VNDFVLICCMLTCSCNTSIRTVAVGDVKCLNRQNSFIYFCVDNMCLEFYYKLFETSNIMLLDRFMLLQVCQFEIYMAQKSVVLSSGYHNRDFQLAFI